ncbi:hypothetical protein AUJ84_03750 [Candidatus Pacearchaeota archaeon CG1_02_32_132]|nr:MAG: hypothetical protein AUJ84_03750 [Candidatus Pacearchaeota archaeon CG1_02_32_132]
MISDYFILALRNIRKRKLRSWLTLIGIFVSIATIFVLIALSLGLQGAVEEQFRILGTDKFFVQPRGQLAGPGTGGAVELTQKDLDVIKKVQGVKEITGFLITNGKIEYHSQIRYTYVIGIDLETADLFLESGSMSILEGRQLKKGDTKDTTIGYDYEYRNVFDKPVTAGDTILINDVEFKVRGVISRIGNPQDDKNILMPIDEARALFGIPDRFDNIVVQVESGEDISVVAARVEKKLRTSRDVAEKTQDFTILTPEELLASIGTILNIITGFLLGIASLSLIVGGIGIANTMYTSVVERRKEIGVMKAVGAKNSDITLIFLIESGLLGLVGGIMGVILGIIIGKTIEYIAVNQLGTTLLAVAFPSWLIIGCLVFAFLAGAISGTLPAIQAARIKPTEALRYE